MKVKATNTNSVQRRTKAVVAGIGADAKLFGSLASNATALQNQSGVLADLRALAGEIGDWNGALFDLAWKVRE